MHTIDVTGLSCPLPVIQVKKEIDAGNLPLQVSVSVGAPRENIKRLAASCGLKVSEQPAGNGVFTLELTKA